jgi:perosamine synthetase
MLNTKIPWSVPDITSDEDSAIRDVMATRWLGMGPRTKEFESALCNYTSARNAVVVNNGTSALITALLAHGISPGDKILVPTYTFIATVNSIIAIGAKPILVDCDPTTFNIAPSEIEKAISEHDNIKALIFVDVAGMPCDIDEIVKIANKHNLILIEDAAESFGAKYKSKMIGSFDHTAIFSFHIAKQMTMVEGGAVVSRDPGVAEKSRLIRSHGEGKDKYIHVSLGLNFRPTDLQSAIGLVQLRKVEKYIELRRRIAKLYIDELENVLEFQHVSDYVSRHPYMLFMCLTKQRKERDQLNKFLNDKGVDTRIPWPPVHRQPYHESKLDFGKLPNADNVYGQVISLPIGNAITDSQALHVVDIVKEYFKNIK